MAGKEGSRGGRIIGHTKSGKPIYGPGKLKGSKSAIQKQAKTEAKKYSKGFDKRDHLDAQKIHRSAEKKHRGSTDYDAAPSSERWYHAAAKKHHYAESWKRGPISHGGLGSYGSSSYMRQMGYMKSVSAVQTLESMIIKSAPPSVSEKQMMKLKEKFGEPRAFKVAWGWHKKYGKAKKALDSDILNLMKAYNIVKEQKMSDLEKAGKGPGSRGGKVIGHTRSGKPVYSPGSGLVNAHSKYRTINRENPGVNRSARKRRGSGWQHLEAHLDQHVNKLHGNFDVGDHQDARAIHMKVAAKQSKVGQQSKVGSRKRDAAGLSSLLAVHHANASDRLPKYAEDDADKSAKSMSGDLASKSKGEAVKSLEEISDLVKAGKGPGSRGGKISRHTKKGKPVYASHDHKLGTRMSGEAYHQSDVAEGYPGVAGSHWSQPPHDNHARAARTHLAAAFYLHHGGQKDSAKEHMNLATHHHEKAKETLDLYNRGLEDPHKKKPSYDHKWNQKNIEATHALVHGKSAKINKSEFNADTMDFIKSLMKDKLNKAEGADTMGTQAAQNFDDFFKSDMQVERDRSRTLKSLEVEVGEGDNIEVIEVPIEEIAKAYEMHKAGKHHRAKGALQVGNESDGPKKGGNASSKRVGPAGKVVGEVSPGAKSTKKSEDSKDDLKKSEVDDEQRRQSFNAGPLSQFVRDDGPTGDAAIAKAIEAQYQGLGHGNIPSMRNLTTEGSK